MYTKYIHMPTQYGWQVSVPLIKMENDKYIVTGTWHTPKPFFLKDFYIGLSQSDIDKIIETIDQDAKRVWVLDRAHLQYSATLCSLPDDLAENLGFHLQIRVDRDGVIVGKNEVCLSDEILANKFLESRGIKRRQSDITHPVPVLEIEKAWHIVKEREKLKSGTQMSSLVKYWKSCYNDDV